MKQKETTPEYIDRSIQQGIVGFLGIVWFSVCVVWWGWLGLAIFVLSVSAMVYLVKNTPDTWAELNEKTRIK